jgi:hypothetical protein
LCYRQGSGVAFWGRSHGNHPPSPAARRTHPRSSSSRRWHNPLVDISPRLIEDIVCLRIACQSAGAVNAFSSTAANLDTMAATRREPPDASSMVSADIAQLRCEMPACRLQCQHKSSHGRCTVSRGMSAHNVSTVTMTRCHVRGKAARYIRYLEWIVMPDVLLKQRLLMYNGHGRRPQWRSSSRPVHER